MLEKVYQFINATKTTHPLNLRVDENYDRHQYMNASKTAHVQVLKVHENDNNHGPVTKVGLFLRD